MAGPQDIVEQPDIPNDSQAQPEPTAQRTTTQQKKQDNLLAQQARENGQESNRSRSQSRRDRRKRLQKAMDDGKQHMKTNSLEALEEADANQELMAMQPFERIGPDSTSMDGPVTMARAERGEIPVRGSNPNQPYYMKPQPEKGVRYSNPNVQRCGVDVEMGTLLTIGCDRAR